LWGEKDKNWSIGPLRNWSASTPVVEPVILCARCTKKRNGDGRDFTIGDYPKSTPEDRAAWGEAAERFRQEFHNKPAKVAKAGQ
jgi:hypothetical protein